MRTDALDPVVLSTLALITLSFSGCGSSSGVKPAAAPASAAPVVADQPQPAQPSADVTEISPALIQKVNDLIRSNKEYIALAETIKTAEEFKKSSDELSRIEQESSSLVEDIMIAEAKLSAAQQAEFTSKYYDALAKPTIELKKQHSVRVQALVR